MAMKSENLLKDLQVIPGVGPSIARDLIDLGILHVRDLRGASPERLYEARCEQVGQRIDRCLLYVFRCAVYYATAKRHDPEMLKWWNWKDDRAGTPRATGKRRKSQKPKRSTRSTRT
jgi:hypothetical protein